MSGGSAKRDTSRRSVLSALICAAFGLSLVALSSAQAQPMLNGAPPPPGAPQPMAQAQQPPPPQQRPPQQQQQRPPARQQAQQPVNPQPQPGQNGTVAMPQALAAPNPDGRWTNECAPQGNPCAAVVRTMRGDGRQQLVTVSVGHDPRQPQRIVATILLPFGLNVRETVPMVVDERFVATLPVETCVPAGCITTMTMVPALRAILEKGTEMRLLALTSDGNTAVLPVTLKGFGEAMTKITPAAAQ